MLTSKQIRSGFIDFFKDKGHEFVPSSPLVPTDDQSLLFINAGMNQFKDIFLGLTAPEHSRVANSQKCLRVSGKHNDLEEVGKDTYHHTFFEMLGNWSFDDYFKAEAIEWAWELLTKVWGIDADKLWATVFAGDTADSSPSDQDAKQLWPKVTGISAEHVLFCGKKDNFWEMGETGPCGPCSEIHIDLGPEMCDMKEDKSHKCSVNGGCARFIELWNLVFIQYNRKEDGELVPLSANYIDTGAGLERIVAVLQNKKSNYDTDLFSPITDAIGEITGRKYQSRLNDKIDNAFRVISDHIRSLTFAITDGATPSNEGRGYVIRRILRRASRFGRELGIHQPFIYKLVPVMVDAMGDAFGEIKQRADFVSTVIESEEEAFSRTLDRGIEIFNTATERAEKTKSKTINGEDAFQLYDTYGFPLDLTQLMAEELSLNVDTKKFDQLMEQQRQRARAAQKSGSSAFIFAGKELPTTDDSKKYETDTFTTKVVGLTNFLEFYTEGTFTANDVVRPENKGHIHISKDDRIGVVLEETCFYAEAGGQVGDSGKIESANCKVVVEETEKLGDCVLQKGYLISGKISVGDEVRATVDKNREAIRKNHTATHLLQWALQTVVDKSISQQGSFVEPDRFRFDFTYPKALSAEQIKEVEKLVRKKIAQDLPVTCAVMPRDKAEKLGAMALFGEKYGSEVRVVAIGAAEKNQLQDALSREFCGGTHCDNTGQIGNFKITKEESISAGVRRITALTGEKLNEFLQERSEIVDKLSELLKTPTDGLLERVQRLLEENKKLSKELKSAARHKGSDAMAEAKQLLDKCEKIEQASIIVGKLSTTSAEQGRSAIDMLKKKAKSAAIVLAFVDDGKVTLLAGVTDDLIKKSIKAGDIVKEIAPIVDGAGGGRPQMAQAGGKNPDKINDALDKAKDLIKEKLTNT
ncbi:alanine--tRNA ligase [Planctomycetota bacterium]